MQGDGRQARSLPRSLAPYLTTFGVVLSINNLSLAQPRFASLQAQGFITSNVSNPLPSDTKNVMLTRTFCCASVRKREAKAQCSASRL
jgi:hypothetical protein